MFRILIVEDIYSTLEAMRDGIKTAFEGREGRSDAKVHTAGAVDEAITLINEERGRGKSYHAAVLDFKLPKTKGAPPEGDLSICETLKQSMPNTLIVHITAYDDDKDILKHLKAVHMGRLGSEAELIIKQGNWPEKLISALKAYLYGGLIEEQMQDVFGLRDRQLKFRTRSSAAPPSARGERSLTHAIATLSRDIESYWHVLDEELRQKIHTVFRVDTYGQNVVRVSLIRETKGKD